MERVMRLKESYNAKKSIAKVEAYLDQFLHFPYLHISDCALYTLHAGGKRMRPAIVLQTAAFFDNEENVIPLAAVMELIHMSSLIHDDIIDQAETRRGKKTLNMLHGSQSTLHIGNYILAEAIHLVKTLPQGDNILAILGNLSKEMCYGEIQQLLSMYDTNQTLEDYYYRINRKTALLLAVCCQTSALASGAEAALVQKFYDIGYNLGMAFQIKDDILDMMMDEKQLGKPAGSDLAHGILTLPTILVLNKDFPEKESLLRIIEERFPQGQAQVELCLRWIKKYQGLEDAEKYAQEYIRTAKALIESLPDYPEKKQFVASADYFIKRSY